MNCVNALIVFTLMLLLGGNYASDCSNQAPTVPFIVQAEFNDCEGREAANYTFIVSGAYNSEGITINDLTSSILIQYTSKYKAIVMSLQLIFRTAFPAGANVQYETLSLVKNGPLQGYYIYTQQTKLSASYLKRFSSVLGSQNTPPISFVLLIIPKLSERIFTSPNGAFQAFKKEATTICTSGNGFTVA